jgi:septal ring factor EnvC (AmiA/AmiB activator)
MSLYGHNQVLYRQTGDWVAAGDLVANVGNSGGQSKSGLYFEIRNAGKPSNPQQWCQIRSQAKAA